MPQKKPSKFNFIKKHKKISIAIIIILLILAFFLRPKPPVPIETQTIKTGDITQSLSASGTIDSATSVDLNFITAGKLVYLGVKQGDHVQAGQTIAILDQRSLQKNLETALRNYSEQRNTFDQTIDDNQGRTPNQALNDAMKRILEDNQYDLDKAVLSVELQDLTKQQSVLTTPISGIVTQADVQTAGVNVTATTNFKIADPDNLIFKVDIDEADISKVKPGQKIKITLDPYPDQTITISVTQIDFVTHLTSTGGNAYTVQANLPQDEKFDYRVGMNGDAEIISAQKNDVITAPLAAITDDNYVYIKTGNTFKKQKVTLGIQNDTDAQITNGLNPGDQVALDPTAAEKTTNQKTKIPFFNN